MNAFQSIPEGGVGILGISTGKIGGFIEIKIKDTGVGISKGNLNKIFSPFFTSKAKGAGLGLSTAKRMIEDHGGTITVESKVGKGTSVTVRVPIPT